MKTFTLRLFGIPILQLDVVEWEPVAGEVPEYEPQWPTVEVDEPRVLFSGRGD